jgi:hypothetical protein
MKQVGKPRWGGPATGPGWGGPRKGEGNGSLPAQLTGAHRYGRAGKPDGLAAQRTAGRVAREHEHRLKLSQLMECGNLSVELAVTIALLDRIEGKPAQRVVNINGNVEAAEIARLSDAELEAELVRLERLLSRRPLP